MSWERRGPCGLPLEKLAAGSWRATFNERDFVHESVEDDDGGRRHVGALHGGAGDGSDATPPAQPPPSPPPRRPPRPTAPRRAGAGAGGGARPYPEGAKIAYIDIQAVASNSADGKAATGQASGAREEEDRRDPGEDQAARGRADQAADELDAS